jgi:type II secretory pathway pseudopilin PulG
MSEMMQALEYGNSRKLVAGVPRKNRGFTIAEITVAVMIGLILTAMTAPTIVSSMNWYRLQGAIDSATWAIQSTRFQALMAGYPYQVVFTKANNQYQIQNLPAGAAAYANVGAAVPLSGSNISLNQDETLRFSPNGSVLAIPATAPNTPNFTITFNGTTKSITVSTYGNVKITP